MRLRKTIRLVFAVLIVVMGSIGPVEAQANLAAEELAEVLVATDDTEMVSETGKTSIDVTANDSDDSDDFDVVITIETQPSRGMATINTASGEESPLVDYTPNDDASGTDSFIYRACVDGSCDSATVTVYIGTSACTIVGTQGADTLTGTDGDDIICGRKGNDIIRGLGGNDIIFGGRGADTIDGGDGDDLIRGQRGNDTIDGGPGNDRVRGGRGADMIDGGAGNDKIYGGGGDDAIDGGDGDDLLVGKAGADVLTGGEGSDVLRGWRGADILNGDAGNDILYGGRGQDILNGGDGNDVLYGKQHADTLNGGPGDDQLRGNRGPDVLNGGSGNDTLIGGLGSDVLDGGAGLDDCTGETVTNCDASPPVAGLTLLSPAVGTDVFSAIDVHFAVDPLNISGSIQVLVDGVVHASVELPVSLITIDLQAVPAGDIQVTLMLLDPEDATLASVDRTLHHVVLSGEDDPVELQDMYEAGLVTPDEYVLGMIPLILDDELDPDAPFDPSAELTTDVMTLFFGTWDSLSNETKETVFAMNGTESASPQASASQRDLGPASLLAPAQQLEGCDGTTITWRFGLIRGREFCEYSVKAASLSVPDLPAGYDKANLNEIIFFIDPVFDGTDLLQDGGIYNKTDGTVIPAQLIKAANRIWSAQAFYEQELGLTLPELHREGIPFHIFVTDIHESAYSSPFEVKNAEQWIGFRRNLGHPIRVRGRSVNLSDTIVHELFHTFEWDTINWRYDVALGGSRGSTVAFYESAANWGIQEWSVATGATLFKPPHALVAYNLEKIRNQWLSDPAQSWLGHGDFISHLIRAQSRAYSYFPALEWLDEHGDIAGPVSGPGNLVQAVLRGYDENRFGRNPTELIADEIDQGQWANPGGSKFAKAWPRMWTATYLLLDGTQSFPNKSAFNSTHYRWAVYWGSQATAWRAKLEQNLGDPTSLDAYGDGRPAQAAETGVFAAPGVQTRTAELHGLGAAFYDFKTTIGDGTATITIEAQNSGDSDDVELSVMQFSTSKHPDVCIDPATGDPRLWVSDIDGTRGPDGGITMTVDVDRTCPYFTVAVVDVDNRRGDHDASEHAYDLEVELVNESAIVTTNLPGGESGVAYPTYQLLANTPGTWSMSGAPEGLTLSPTGELAGTPNEGNSYNLVFELDTGSETVSKGLFLFIKGPRFETPAPLPTGKTFEPYSQQIVTTVHGNTDKTTVITKIDGDYPPGITIDADGLGSGEATKAGQYTFTLQATDSDGLTAFREYTVTVGATIRLAANVNPHPVEPGQSAAVTFTLSNTGASDASGYVLRFQMPEGIAGVNAPGCSLVAPTVSTFECGFNNLATGESHSIAATFGVDPAARTPDS